MTYQTAVTGYLISGFLLAGLLHRALKQTGRVFLDELFANHPAAGRALVRLLDIGYLLFNLGYMSLAASLISPWPWASRSGSPEGWVSPSATVEGWRAIGSALGGQLLVLAAGHAINIWLFSRKVGRAMRANQREIDDLLRT